MEIEVFASKASKSRPWFLQHTGLQIFTEIKVMTLAVKVTQSHAEITAKSREVTSKSSQSQAGLRGGRRARIRYAAPEYEGQNGLEDRASIVMIDGWTTTLFEIVEKLVAV